jgi:membrane associated rhomboid family serine protease
MLDDRSYMRANPGRPFWSATVILMVSVVICFALQNIAVVYWNGGGEISKYLMLSPGGLKQGFVWQLLTFQFLHGSLGHIFGNLLGLFFFGRTVESRLGSREFLKIYFLCGLGGGILQVLLQWGLPQYFGSGTLGASAGVLGIIAAFALMEPEAPVFIGFLLPLRAKHLLWIELGISLFFTLVPAPSYTANAAHLGGILTAIVYMRWDMQRAPLPWHPLLARRRKRQLVQTAAQVSRWRAARNDKQPAELPAEEFISKEVDPILDKISAHGIQSLTPRERQILEAARSKMARR